MGIHSKNFLFLSIHVGVCHTLIHQRLLPLAENLEMNLNRVFPGGKLAESASRFDLFELVSMGKFFEENVKEFMETKVNDLRPVGLSGEVITVLHIQRKNILERCE